MVLGAGDAEARHARLAGAEDLAAAAQPEILLGDAEAVLGLAHDRQPLAGDGPERGPVEQQAGRRLVAAPDPAAQLMELGEAEALGVLDHHDRGVGHVDADLDDGGGDQHLDLAGEEAGHDRVALRRLHAAVDEADDRTQRFAERRVALLGGGDVVEHLGFLDQRAHPVGLGALGDGAADAADHLVEPVERHDARVDRLAAGRLLGQPRDVHVAVVGEHQRARDRRRGHHQHVGGAALGGQRQALVDAEAVLLVDHHQRQVVEGDARLEEGVGADQQADRAVGEAGEDRLALAALFAAGEHREADAGGLRQRLDRARMLAHEELGRRHHGGLTAGLDDIGGGDQRHHRLARADVALQQAQHALRRGEVRLDVGERRRLAGGEREGQGGHQLGAETPVARGAPARCSCAGVRA